MKKKKIDSKANNMGVYVQNNLQRNTKWKSNVAKYIIFSLVKSSLEIWKIFFNIADMLFTLKTLQ